MIKKSCTSLWKVATFLKSRIKTKNLKTIHRVLEFNQSPQLKPYIGFNTQKRIYAEKNGDKDGKALYKSMNNAIYGKKIEKQNQCETLKQRKKNVHQNQAISHRKYLTIILLWYLKAKLH